MINFIKRMAEKYNIKKLIKFGLVGGLNTFVDYFSFYLIFDILGVDKYIAQTCAVLIAATNSYFLNKNYTFKGQKESAGFVDYLKFMSVNMGSMVLSLVLMFIFVDLLHMPTFLSKIPISGFTVLASFLFYNFWVFKAKK